MKLMKLLGLCLLFVGFSVHSGQMPAINVQAPVPNTDKAILDILYKADDEYKEYITKNAPKMLGAYKQWPFGYIIKISPAFWPYLPHDISFYKYEQVLQEEQVRLKKELDALSYKDVLFSMRNMANAFTFAKDIKDMRDKKKYFSEQYAKCTRILERLISDWRRGNIRGNTGDISWDIFAG